MTVGERIKQRRIELGLSQTDFGKRMGLMAKSNVSRLEHSGNNMTLDTVRKCATALDCTVAYLMGWEEEHDRSDRVAYLLEQYPEVFDDDFIIEYAKSAEMVKQQTKDYFHFVSSK